MSLLHASAPHTKLKNSWAEGVVEWHRLRTGEKEQHREECIGACKIDVPLLRVCKQISAEAALLSFSVNTFIFDRLTTLNNVSGRITKQERNAITHVWVRTGEVEFKRVRTEFSLPPHMKLKAPGYWSFPPLRKLSGLRSVMLIVDSSERLYDRRDGDEIRTKCPESARELAEAAVKVFANQTLNSATAVVNIISDPRCLEMMGEPLSWTVRPLVELSSEISKQLLGASPVNP